MSSKTKTVEFKAEPGESTDGYKYGIVIVDKNMNATYLPTSDKLSDKLKYKTTKNTINKCPNAKYNLYKHKKT